MGDYISIGALVAIITAAIGYIVKKKRKGSKCIGCPYGEQCTKGKCEDNNDQRK